MVGKLTTFLETVATMRLDGECEECGAIYPDRVIEVCTRSTPDTDGASSECGGAVFRHSATDATMTLNQMIYKARQAKNAVDVREEWRNRVFARDWAIDVLDRAVAQGEESVGGRRAAKILSIGDADDAWAYIVRATNEHEALLAIEKAARVLVNAGMCLHVDLRDAVVALDKVRGR